MEINITGARARALTFSRAVRARALTFSRAAPENVMPLVIGQV
ncbi:hypothetical protein LTSEADE_6134 [Salmonella enterica subsp. enterica serovar Adelaide str. A4-669]|uniref:Uncharacterized protein n=1 Tax=Salmonella enterica subsp. enterica serovar Adelaide str. A4-669 TaxID=913063 RepID=A0A6C8GEM5_SALET|nr:hypothetical protein LTSEADE_6134 [Salmonella enterica subsp. enterica serovar Adelaide str. A4-669]